ncbi:MAG: hypothetical protein FJW23_17200 [Acidimicrobiia bacterium]|nr:hypothetical protein [Acidimicrobiia bacterium]
MRSPLLVAFVCLPLVAACRESVDLSTAIEVTDVRTGWYDAGIQDGKNKLVPSISLKLKDASGEPIDGVQINAIFRRVNETEAWGEHYVKAIGQEGLPAGASTPEIVLRSNLGYTGTESRLQMLKNSQFVDAKVDIFGKHGPSTWVKLGEYQIDRTLLTR